MNFISTPDLIVLMAIMKHHGQPQFKSCMKWETCIFALVVNASLTNTDFSRHLI